MLQKVITVIFGIFVLLGCAAAAIAARQYSEKPVEITDAASSVKGTLMMPVVMPEGNKRTVALIIAGSGPTDRNGNSRFVPDNNSLKNLAVALAGQGIASVRYDKRGIGESTATAEADLRFETYIEDAARWLRLLHADKRFDKVLVVGHSEGALIGMVAAQRVDVCGVVSLEGTAMRASDLLRTQLKPQLPADLAQANESILQSLEAGAPYPDAPAAMQMLYRPSVQPYLISWFRYLPVQEIGKVKPLVLIVQGSADVQVEPGAADELLRGNASARLLRVEGMDHLLRTPLAHSSSKGDDAGLQSIANAVARMIE